MEYRRLEAPLGTSEMHPKVRAALESTSSSDELVLWWGAPHVAAAVFDYLVVAAVGLVAATASWFAGGVEASMAFLALATLSSVAGGVVFARSTTLTYVVTTHRILKIARHDDRAPSLVAVATSDVRSVTRYRSRLGSVSFGIFTPEATFEDGIRVPNVVVGPLSEASARGCEPLLRRATTTATPPG